MNQPRTQLFANSLEALRFETFKGIECLFPLGWDVRYEVSWAGVHNLGARIAAERERNQRQQKRDRAEFLKATKRAVSA